MIVADAIQKMILCYDDRRHEVAHFFKVWGDAHTIGTQTGLELLGRIYKL